MAAAVPAKDDGYYFYFLEGDEHRVAKARWHLEQSAQQLTKGTRDAARKALTEAEVAQTLYYVDRTVRARSYIAAARAFQALGEYESAFRRICDGLAARKWYPPSEVEQMTRLRKELANQLATLRCTDGECVRIAKSLGSQTANQVQIHAAKISSSGNRATAITVLHGLCMQPLKEQELESAERQLGGCFASLCMTPPPRLVKVAEESKKADDSSALM
jgi:hypothetical protein